MALNEKALLVKLSISRWYNRVTDKKITNEIGRNHGVKTNEDRYIKTLINKDALTHIDKTLSDIYRFHTNATMPWQDDGVRILPSKGYFAYQRGISERHYALEDEVRTFVALYPEWVKHAENTKGSMFDIAQYPTPEEIKEKYKIHVSILPFPTTTDFRVEGDAGEDIAEQLRVNAQQTIDTLMANATQSLMDRVLSRVYTAYTALKDPEAIFKASTLYSLREVSALVEELNIAEDEQLKDLIKAVRATYLSPYSVRASGVMRELITNDLRTILEQYQWTPKSDSGSQKPEAK